jgi:hypothetical protein
VPYKAKGIVIVAWYSNARTDVVPFEQFVSAVVHDAARMLAMADSIFVILK